MTPTPLQPDAAWRRLVDRTTEPYRAAGRFAWHFARGKLTRDPVFRGLLERGDLSGCTAVVDIGCGQGLMAGLLRACAELQAEGGWPVGWPPPPAARRYQGVELMSRDVARALAAWGADRHYARFDCEDMRRARLEPCDLVVILDVLHYVYHTDQTLVLQAVRTALGPGGRLLLRVGDQSDARGFRASQWVDRVVTRIRGHRAPPTWGRTVPQWSQLLADLGFAVQPVPMSRGTPFANVLLVADLPTGTAAGGQAR
jgi:SAM-dependent methyltransferase